MNVKILGALFTIGVLSAFVGYGTYAYFSDTETSSANVFTAGSLDLLLNNANDIALTIGATDMAPGQSVSGSIVLRSAGSITTGLDVDMKGTALVTDAGPNASDPDDGGFSAPGLDSYLIFTTLSYGGGSILSSYTDTNGDGKISLAEVVSKGTLADLLDPTTTGTTLAATIMLDPIAPNHIKHDSVSMTLTFYLAQAAAPDLA